MISLMLNDVYLQSFWRVGRRRLSGKLEIRPVTQAHKHVECETCVLFCSAVQLPCSRLVRSLLSLRFRVSAAAAATAVSAKLLMLLLLLLLLLLRFVGLKTNTGPCCSCLLLLLLLLLLGRCATVRYANPEQRGYLRHLLLLRRHLRGKTHIV